MEDTSDVFSREVTSYIFSKVRRREIIFFGRRLNFFEFDLTDHMSKNRVEARDATVNVNREGISATFAQIRARPVQYASILSCVDDTSDFLKKWKT